MKQDWQMLVSSEDGGWVQNGSHTLLSCVCFKMFLMKTLKKREVPLKHGEGKTQPRRSWEFCCSKSRTGCDKGPRQEPRHLRIKELSEPSCLPSCSRLEITWDCPGCPWHLQGVPLSPFRSQSKAFHDVASGTCSFLCASRLQQPSTAWIIKSGLCLNSAQYNYATWEFIITNEYVHVINFDAHSL